MNTKSLRFQSVTAVALIAALLTPSSLFAESRPLDQTELVRIAAQVFEAIVQQQQTRRPAPGRRAPERSTPTRTTRDRETTRSTREESVNQPRTSGSSGTISAAAILAEMNQQRQRQGLGPLRLNGRLNLAASDRVRDMFDQRYFDHVSPDGTQPFVWARHRGYRYSTIGENLAEGQRSAREVVNGWMNSPGHRANVLGSSFQDCGLAIAQGSPTGRTRGYTFVALYAREAGARVRS